MAKSTESTETLEHAQQERELVARATQAAKAGDTKLQDRVRQARVVNCINADDGLNKHTGNMTEGHPLYTALYNVALLLERWDGPNSAPAPIDLVTTRQAFGEGRRVGIQEGNQVIDEALLQLRVFYSRSAGSETVRLMEFVGRFQELQSYGCVSFDARNALAGQAKQRERSGGHLPYSSQRH